jgi:hypothetical protein
VPDLQCERITQELPLGRHRCRVELHAACHVLFEESLDHARRRRRRRHAARRPVERPDDVVDGEKHRLCVGLMELEHARIAGETHAGHGQGRHTECLRRVRRRRGKSTLKQPLGGGARGLRREQRSTPGPSTCARDTRSVWPSHAPTSGGEVDATTHGAATPRVTRQVPTSGLVVAARAPGAVAFAPWP